MTAGRATNYQWPARGFLVPGLALVVVVLYLPLLYTAYLSFTDYNGLGTPEWNGVDNYVAMFLDRNFLQSVTNTLAWVLGSILIPVFLGLGLAYLTFGIRGGAVFRAAFLVPYALSGVAVGVVWGFILQEQGALTQALAALGIPGAETRWLQEWPLNTIVMILASAWQGVGVNALLFTVGLQSIPKETIEAARMDGATGFTLFRHMVWPLLRPATVVVIGLTIVNSLKTFDIVQAMTDGGPGRVSETLAVTMYRETFFNSDYGLGSAIAVFLAVITVGTAAIYLRQQLRQAANESGRRTS